MSAVLRAILLAASMLSIACSERSLVVALRTDYVPRAEFDRVRVVVVSGARRAPWDTSEQPASQSSERYVRGISVAAIRGLADGDALIEVSLLAGDRRVASRSIRYRFSGSAGVTAVIARTCAGVLCVDDQTCDGGRCVDPACTPETPETCPEPMCRRDDGCERPVATCAAARCVAGTCLTVDEGDSCGTGTYCRPDEGCVPFVPDAPDGGGGDGDAGQTDAGGADGGESDAGDDFGADAGATDAGAPLLAASFWAGGPAGVVARSETGSTWEFIDTGVTDSVLDIATHDGRIVAVGGSCATTCRGFIATSSDAVEWTVVRSTGQPIYAVVRGAGQFVAAGLGGQLMTSPDGVTWTSRSGPPGWWRDLTEVSGGYVVVGQDMRIATSADGAAWLSRGTTRAGTHLFRVAVGGDVVVAVGSNEMRIRSIDGGLTWTDEVSGGSSLFDAVLYTGSEFIVGDAFRSADGTSWRRVGPGGAVTYGAGMPGLIAIRSGWVFRSDDGIAWVPFDTMIGHGFARIDYGP